MWVQGWGQQGMSLSMVQDHSRRLHCHMVVVPLPPGTPPARLDICHPDGIRGVVAAVAALLTKGQVCLLDQHACAGVSSACVNPGMKSLNK